ncbi:MAG: nucleotide exchange factor GrpE [Lachnospiraceae bacterium]|nr:nucleotide exchange factor GrpE [Lachnospiraceae bacterium]
MPDINEEIKEDRDKEENMEPKEEEAKAEEPLKDSDKEEDKEEEIKEEPGEEEEGKENASEEKDKKKGSRWKKDKKEKKDKKDDLIEELSDRVKRQMAEFENFRKRTDKEKSSMYEMGAKSVIEKILPVIDNFERGLDTVSEEEKSSGFAEGMNKIYKQLMTELENMGVKPIEALGKEFDPSVHNAVMQVDSEEYESGVIAQELQKGYTYHDSVVRHSMVAVVK